VPSWIVAMLLACALLSTLVVAAAGDDPKLPAIPSRAYSLDASEVLPNLVTIRDLERTRAGTPAFSLMAAFQAVQFKDISRLRSLIVAEHRSSSAAARVADAVRVLGPALGRPVVAGTRREGDLADVRVVVLAYPGAARNPTQAQTYTV
jgi:hypothetical protein